ncbi:MAG: hypothetical protein ACX930_11485 [Erythrobacter sp.]
MSFQPWWKARAFLIAHCGEAEQASIAFDRAIGLADKRAACLYLVGEKN